MRLFVALPLPQDLKQALQKQISKWQAELPFRRWVHPSDLHLTLQFIGECTPQQAQRLHHALATITMAHQPLRLSLHRLGFFGSARQPRILWLGVNGELQQLAKLQAHISETLFQEKLIAQQEQRFTPHITIARNYQGESPFSSQQLLDSNQRTNLEHGAWLAEEIVIYQTHLGQQPMYDITSSMSLIGKNK